MGFSACLPLCELPRLSPLCTHSGNFERVKKLVNQGRPYRFGVIQAAIEDSKECEKAVIEKTKQLLKKIGALEL